MVPNKYYDEHLLKESNIRREFQEKRKLEIEKLGMAIEAHK